MSLQIIDAPGARALAPRVDRFTAQFWDALAAGELRTTRCTACARASFPPRRFCAHCGAGHTEWFTLSGSGTLYSYTTIHAAPSMFPTPYTLAIVDLDEGVRLVTRLLDEYAPRIGARVRIVVTRHADGCLFAAIQLPPENLP